jgi:aminotransferase
MNTKSSTITILTENKPGVLYRIANLFLRRKVNIESLHVSETENKGTSRFVIVVSEEEALVTKISKQLKRIIEVINVHVETEKDTSAHISDVAAAIEVSMIKRIELLSRAQKDSISLAQGTPSFFTARHIKEAVIDAMNKGLTDKYTPGYGIEPLRIAMTEKVKKDNGIAVKPSQVIVTHGAIEAMMAILLALLNPEDDVLMPTPNYASHITQVKIALRGKSPIFVPFKETAKGLVLDIEGLEKAVTPQTKAIIICNPSNPTGKVYSKEELKAVAKLAIKHNLYIITDEMYEYLLYDNNTHVSIGSFPEVADRTISIFGVSKSYAMTGWRIGYIVANQKLIDEIFKIHDSLITCPTGASQYAALAALTGPQDVVKEYREEFIKRRKIVGEELAKTKLLSYTPPQGAYYAFVKVTKPVDDVQLCMDLVKNAGVAVVPGSPFGKGGEGYIRISFHSEEPVLREALQRLVKYMDKKYKNS